MNISKNKEYRVLLNSLRVKQYKLSEQSGKSHSERDLEVYKEMINLFYQKNNRYPTVLEFNHKNLLPSARLIQRNYGGVQKFRELMDLEVINYTKGQPRIDTMKIISKRAKDYEQELYILLYNKFHKPKEGFVVEREPVISGVDPENDVYGYKRADVGINNFNVPRDKQKKSTYIDFFYASTKESLFGCVNIKNKKIKGIVPLKDIIYVSINPEFSQEDINSFTLPKKSPRVLSREEFMKEFLK